LEMQLEIHSYLGRDERVQCYNAPTLFQNLLKRFLTCRVSATMPNCPISRIIINANLDTFYNTAFGRELLVIRNN
jgi:hypothetical protein